MTSATNFKLVLHRDQVECCATRNWYQHFQKPTRCTIRTVFVHPLPQALLNHLQTDGISTNLPTSIEKFTQDVTNALSQLNNNAFVKFTWSSPRDAQFLTGSLKCSTAEDVLLLLKASDFVQHDLRHAFDKTVSSSMPIFLQFNGADFEECKNDGNRGRELQFSDYEHSLVLRSWSELNKAQEFRCFVVNGGLIAICQRYASIRECALMYESEIEKKRVISLVQEFFNARVRNVVETMCMTRSVTMDVYIDKKNKIWLLDFGVLPAILTNENFDSLKDEIHQKFRHQQRIANEAENESAVIDLDKISEDLYSTPPHELLSWKDLEELVRFSEKEEAQSAMLPKLFVTESQNEADKFAGSKDILSAHRVPIELLTGELNGHTAKTLDEMLKEIQLNAKPSDSDSDADSDSDVESMSS